MADSAVGRNHIGFRHLLAAERPVHDFPGGAAGVPLAGLDHALAYVGWDPVLPFQEG
jgi:hypothetical protein